MKFIKTFENIDINIMENNTNKRFLDEFYKLYPKKETILHFKDRDSIYDLYFDSIKFNTLIFKTESGQNVSIENPYNISNIDLEKISLLPVEITTESKELVNEMFEKIK